MSDASRDAQRPSYEQLEALVAEQQARIEELGRVIAELRAVGSGLACLDRHPEKLG